MRTTDARRKLYFRRFFSKEKAELICYIPISLTGLHDRRIWAYGKNGLFSIISAYHLDMTRKQRGRGESLRGT